VTAFTHCPSSGKATQTELHPALDIGCRLAAKARQTHRAAGNVQRLSLFENRKPLARMRFPCYLYGMKSPASQIPLVVPVDDEHARMMEYARSPEGKARIAEAQAEIDSGNGIAADDAYFENLKVRRARHHVTS
jgi:hypothetical protein